MTPTAVGTPAERREAHLKVTGTAHYAAEHALPGRLYARPVPATIARGRVTAVDASAALGLPGVVTVLSHADAPRLGEPDDPTLAVLQDPKVPHRGWPVALVVAETLEAARAGAAAVRVTYAEEPHDVVLTEDHPQAYVPEKANGGYPAVRERGDAEGAFAGAAVRVDATYRVPPLHNHPMEPHASTAHWDGDRLTVYTSSQGTSVVRMVLAGLFGLPEERITVAAEHV
ncbi:xanthine dehydrogenase, partial [Streptomyces sp. Ru71]|uniref:xanthine dehydrogenase family protein molybdopterin-binding subunit n=1 Tax=Streptomyces sp. Ru71 TaxID=2080746 RepID=UPI000D492410